MIRLAFVTDKNHMIGCTLEEDRLRRAEAWPEPLTPEIGKMFYGENTIVGSVTYAHNLETFSNLNPGDKELLVLTRDRNFDLHGNTKALLVHEHRQIVDRYRDSDEVLVVGGGKVMWELFLPYADEMAVACCDKALPGDIEFRSWKEEPMVELRRDLWEGGATIYYKRNS
jgi:hypothetical protein